MSQENQKARKMKTFQEFQITSKLAEKGSVKPGWKFMHCLLRHSKEVSDDVFYSSRSLVFKEAKNWLWATIAVLKAFIVNKDKILWMIDNARHFSDQSIFISYVIDHWRWKFIRFTRRSIDLMTDDSISFDIKTDWFLRICEYRALYSEDVEY